MDLFITIYIFIIGLFFGSFYNVLGIRIPKRETLMGRSHCNNCDHQIGWLELIPIIGYIYVGGKCKKCKTPISIKYPLIELLTALIFSVSYMILKENMIEYILVVVFFSLMTIVTVSDMYYREVPDILLVIFLPLILGLRIFSDFMPWYESIIGGVVGFLFMYIVALYGKKRFQTDALGGGDIKLYLLIGLFLGYNTVFLSLIFAAVAGMIYGLLRRDKEDRYVAFVPFIFFGTLVAYFFGDMMIEYYNQFLLSFM